MILKKISHIALILIILATTSGFTVDYHFCHDHLVSVAIDKPAEPCCTIPCGHCENKEIVVHLENEYVASIAALDLGPEMSPSMYLNGFHFEPEYTLVNKTNNCFLKIPLTERDIPVLNSSFLI